MRLPIVPLVVAATLLAAVVSLFNASSGATRRILDAPKLTRLADIPGIETEVAISPDGGRCAVIADNDLWILNLSDGSQRRVTESPEKERFPAWSPDGQRLAFTRGEDTFITKPDQVQTPELFRPGATYLSWSSTGRLMYVHNGGLWLTDIGERNEQQLVPPDENPNITIRSPRFSPDTLQIGFIKSLLNISGQVWTVDALNGKAGAIV